MVIIDISDDKLCGKLSDEEYARRLQEEENNRLASEQLSQSSTAATSTVDEEFNDTTNDEEYAKRLALQLRDEQIAENLQELENAQRSVHQQVRQEQLHAHHQFEYQQGAPDGFIDVQTPARRRCCGRKGALWKSLLSLLFLVVTIGLILVFLTPLGRQVGIGDIDIPEIIFGGDDWAGTPDASSFSSWGTKGEGGLRLTIENALTSDWHPYFSVAFTDWDAAPALELTLAKREEGPDPLCDPVEGIMKVCNARYGVTGWVGLNEVYFNPKGFITQSVAKMNESYLKLSNQDEKQYVVCHEMGHGFGLPHRDENPNNANLGSCLDYTKNHKGNQHPDFTDYENLEKLYDTVPTIDGLYGVSNSKPPGGRNLPSIRNGDGEVQPYGRLLKSHKHGASYERPHRSGGKIITNVLWA